MNTRESASVRPICTGLLLLAMLSLLGATSTQAQDGDATLAIKAGRIFPVNAAPIEQGIILVKQGKIQAVGKDIEIPEDATVIDASDKVVIPGLIHAMTTLNERGRDDEGSVTPDIHALDSFDYFGKYHRLLAGGVTTVHIAPGRNRLMPGYGAVVKLAADAPDQQVLKAVAGLSVVLGEAPKNPPPLFDPPVPPEPDNQVEPAEPQLPTTRMGQMAMLRNLFSRAVWTREASKPLDDQTEAILPVLDKDQTLRVNCHTAQDIRNALALAKAFDLELVIEGATEAYRLIDEIKAGNASVILASDMEPGRSNTWDNARPRDVGRVSTDTVSALAGADIPFALASASDQTIGDLQFIAGTAVSRGVSPRQALTSVTLSPARLLGISDRVGSLETGKDADLVILSANPFDLASKVERTLVGGKTVYCRANSDTAPTQTDKPVTAIKAGLILTGSRGRIPNGLILIQDGKILYSGKDKPLPEDATVVDASKDVVIPGMIDINSRLGLHRDSLGIGGGGSNFSASSNAARLASIAHAVTPDDEAFDEVLCSGVTSVLLAPSGSGMVGGNGAVIKLVGDTLEARLVKDYAAVTFSMTGGSPRMAKIWEARDLLKRAKSYADQWDRYEKSYKEYEQRKARSTPDLVEPPRQPSRDTNLELLRGLFERKMPALVQAGRDDEIRNTLTVFRDEFNLDTILVGAGNAYRMVSELRRHNIGVALGPNILTYDKTKAINNAALLSQNGIRVALQSSATSGTQYLPMSAAYAIRHGMEAEQALQAVTLTPARLLHVEDRIGSLDAGKDADLVILTGAPFEFSTQVKAVMINGKVVYRRPVK